MFHWWKLRSGAETNHEFNLYGKQDVWENPFGVIYSPRGCPNTQVFISHWQPECHSPDSFSLLGLISSTIHSSLVYHEACLKDSSSLDRILSLTQRTQKILLSSKQGENIEMGVTGALEQCTSLWGRHKEEGMLIPGTPLELMELVFSAFLPQHSFQQQKQLSL